MRFSGLTAILSAAVAVLARSQTAGADSSESGSRTSSRAGPSGSGVVGETGVEPEPTAVVLPAGQLQSLLLSSSSIHSDSPVEVYINHAATQQQLSSLLPTVAVTANTSVFVSVLVAPSLEGNLSRLGADDGFNASNELDARTQL